MKCFALDKIAFHRQSSRGALPFEFRRQARAAPVGVSVRLKIADMRHRLGFIDRAETGEGEVPPFPVALFPVERRLPALFVYSRPA